MDISNNDTASTPGASASRRKSGRAVKVPEKFIPDVPSSQIVPAGSKRKRGEGTGENDASELEEEEEEEVDDEDDIEEEEESAAEEEIKASRRKPAPKSRKPAAKKAKVNGTSTEAEPRALPVRLPARPKKTSKRVAIADKDAEGLYGRRIGNL